jgi:hypothetical protein
MKKMIGVALVSALLGMAPLLASAQMGQGSGSGMQTMPNNNQMTPMTTEKKTTTTTTHRKNEGQTGDTGYNSTVEKNSGHMGANTMEKNSGHMGANTMEKTTTKKVESKKPTTKATHSVKKGHSAVRESASTERAEQRAMKKHHRKHAMKKHMHKKVSSTTKTTTKTGQNMVRESSATQAKQTPTHKVGQAFKNTGNKIHQGWDKMTHQK